LKELLLSPLRLLALVLLSLPVALPAVSRSAQRVNEAPWIWLEAEEFAQSNFPYASARTRGVYCEACSGQEYLLFDTRGPGRPFDPPGYWYVDYALRVKEAGDYRYVWIALSPAEASFSWTIDGQPPIRATVVQTTSPYGPSFRWARLTTAGLNLQLDPQKNPHTLTLRRDDPSAARMQIDAIVLTTDSAWVPSGIQQPPVDRSYLDAYVDYVLYAKSYLEHILPTTIPERDEITDKISTFAALGEYEPLSFAIYARTNLKDVTARVSDLVQGAEVIAAENIDVRVVRVITKRRDRSSKPDETELVPEILDYNSPQDIPAGTSKQYWLIIHVPPETVPGIYEGTIRIAPANAPAQQMALSLEVLPFTLEDSLQRHHSIAYNLLREFDGQRLPDDPFIYMRQDYQDMRQHGLTSADLVMPVLASLEPGGAVKISYDDFVRGMELLIELGFTGPVHWQGINRLYRDLKALHVSQQTLESTLVGVVDMIVKMARARRWPLIYFFPVDEPFGDPEKEEELYYLAPLIKRVPGALVEVSLGGAGSLPAEADPFTDVRFYNGWRVDSLLPVQSFADIVAQAQASGDRLGVYYNAHKVGGRPKFARVTAGLYFWNSPFQDFGVWTYHFFVGDPYDDTDGPTGDIAYAYPDPARNFAPTLPTLRWEGFREGVDDVRYLYTLEQAIEAAAANPAKATAVEQARGLLEALRADLNRYGPEAQGIIAYFQPDDFSRYRYSIAQAIITLKER